MNADPVATTRLYLSGRLVELWEDPDRPFGCAQTDLQAYLDREAWVLLFNALVLAAGHGEREAGS
jgi:hypothetical protein